MHHTATSRFGHIAIGVDDIYGVCKTLQDMGYGPDVVAMPMTNQVLLSEIKAAVGAWARQALELVSPALVQLGQVVAAGQPPPPALLSRALQDMRYPPHVVGMCHAEQPLPQELDLLARVTHLTFGW